MNIVSILFWLLIGVFFIWGALFQYHEIAIGVCALLIGISQLVATLKAEQK
jgi:hypothetical protein